MKRLAITATFALLVSACARDDGERHELDGLAVVEDFDEAICGGTFAALERRLIALERQTGLPRDPLGLVFHWVFDREALPEDCRELVSGCARGRDFYSQLDMFSHELAHSHLSRLGSPRLWLREGMATMLEDTFRGSPDPTVTPSDLLPIEDSLGLNYTAAGTFTAFLRDRYGMARLLDYYAASDRADVASSLVIFRDVFGEDFAATEARYLASDRSNVVGFLDCDAPEIAWSGDTWIHSFTLTCDEPTSVGPQQPLDEPERPLLWAGVTLTAPAGWFTFDLETTAPTWISILRCDRPAEVYLSADEPHINAYLDGGSYLVFVDAYIDMPSSATLTARRLERAPNSAATHNGRPAGFRTHLVRDRSRHE